MAIRQSAPRWCLVAAIGCFPLSALAQRQAPVDSEDVPIEVAVADYIRRAYPRGRLGFEDIQTGFARRAGESEPPRGVRSQARVQRILGALQGQAVALSSDAVCSPEQRGECVEFVLRIGAPTIDGDSAMVWAFVHIASDREEFNRYLFVKRGPGGWTVEREVDRYRTYYGPPAPPG